MLSISALFWMILMIAMVAEPEEAGDVILSGLVLSNIFLGLGIYYVWCAKSKYKRKALYG
jgi:membrane protein DedA with SNARE-associated domain